MGFDELVDEFCSQLQRRQIEGSVSVAKRTVEFMRTLVTQNRHPDAQSLLQDVRKLGVRLQKAKPTELVVGNVTRRVMRMIREEHEEEKKAGPSEQDDEEPSTTGFSFPGVAAQGLTLPINYPRISSLKMLLDPVPHNGGLPDLALNAYSPHKQFTPPGTENTSGKKKRMKSWKYKSNVIELINEFIDELDSIPGQIAQQSVDHIHAHEVVLTLGMSETTFLFLESAGKRRPELQVVVAEGAPRFCGHKMAKRLSDAGIQTTVITDAAIFAMMARVNQVFVGCEALLANGGVIAQSGCHLVAQAAKEHSVPFVVLVGLHKLSPYFPHDPTVTLNDFKSPLGVADFDILAESMAATEGVGAGQTVDVPNPSFDYVPPELISLFMTDQGGLTPTYIYRLLDEFYTRDDYVLSEEVLDLLTN